MTDEQRAARRNSDYAKMTKAVDDLCNAGYLITSQSAELVELRARVAELEARILASITIADSTTPDPVGKPAIPGWREIATDPPPTDKNGFLAASMDDGEPDGIEWLSGPIGTDGRRWNQTSGNRTTFPATHWAPLPGSAVKPDSCQPMFLIRKRGAFYYRPDCQGYTTSIDEAGHYTQAQAERETHPNGPDGPRDGMSYIPVPVQTGHSPDPLGAEWMRAAAAELIRSTAYTTSSDGRRLEPVRPSQVGADMHHATIAAAIRARKGGAE